MSVNEHWVARLNWFELELSTVNVSQLLCMFTFEVITPVRIKSHVSCTFWRHWAFGRNNIDFVHNYCSCHKLNWSLEKSWIKVENLCKGWWAVLLVMTGKCKLLHRLTAFKLSAFHCHCIWDKIKIGVQAWCLHTIEYQSVSVAGMCLHIELANWYKYSDHVWHWQS